MLPGLVNIQKAIENGPVEIVDFPSYKMVIFQFAMCKGLPGRVDVWTWSSSDRRSGRLSPPRGTQWTDGEIDVVHPAEGWFNHRKNSIGQQIKSGLFTSF